MPDPDLPLDADTLRALEDRLERATRAAERLLGEAGGGGEVPPGGWQRREGAGETTAGGPWVHAADGERLLAVLATVLERIPLELQQRLAAAAHELLLAIRALVDWCLERAQRRQAAPAEVQDIPIL